jgi:hypothetical protein
MEIGVTIAMADVTERCHKIYAMCKTKICISVLHSG